MKLVIVTPSFYPSTFYGGPIHSTFELAKVLKKSGIDVRVITTNANGNERLKLRTGTFHKLETDLPVKYYNSLDSRGTSLSMLWNLWSEIKSADIVYLISIFSAPTPFTIFICKLLKKPLIISPRGQLGKWCLEQGNRFKQLWLKLFIKPFINRLFWHLTSEEEQRAVKLVYLKAKTFVIPNGINVGEFDSRVNKIDKLYYKKYSSSVNANSKIIISMGRLQKVKGFEILIESFEILLKQFPDSFLLIAGEDFGDRANLLNLITSDHLSDKIFLVGHIEGEEKVSFLKNADVFALPSHHENFGIVYAESLASGTPIVASKNTPWQDVEKYKCGKWVENTSDKFAEAMLDILKSNPIQMGANGRKYVEENFSWNKIALDFKVQTEKIMTSIN